MQMFTLHKIVIPPQIMPKEFYEYFGVIYVLEFINYYEILIKSKFNQRDLVCLLNLMGIRTYFLNKIHPQKKSKGQKTPYRITLPSNYSRIELLKLRACNLIY